MSTSVPTRKTARGTTEYYYDPGDGLGPRWQFNPPGTQTPSVGMNPHKPGQIPVSGVPQSQDQIPSHQGPCMPEGGKDVLKGIVNSIFGEDGFGTDDLLKILGIGSTALGAYSTAKGASQAGKDSDTARQLTQTAITRALQRATESDQERAKGAPLRDEFRASAMNYGDPTNPFRHPNSMKSAPPAAPPTGGIPATPPPPGFSMNPDVGALSPDKLAGLEQVRGLLGFGLPAGQSPTGSIMGRLMQAIKLSQANGLGAK